jgi:8-oxo-dGTP pyrophosphatase MutT (NUDIX family)
MAPSDNLAYRFPVSIKGVVFLDDRIPLLENERSEWELPGGKLEPHESPIDCCAREIQEELNITARVERILDSWVYTIAADTRVLIVTYGCRCDDGSTLKISHEHKTLKLFTVGAIETLNMPQGYKDSIYAWATLIGKRS